MWNLSGFLCKNPKCPGAQGRRPLCQSRLRGAVLNCAILAVAPTDINDISSDIESEIRLFADDCVCYRETKDEKDTMKLQRDIDRLVPGQGSGV